LLLGVAVQWSDPQRREKLSLSLSPGKMGIKKHQNHTYPHRSCENEVTNYRENLINEATNN
jgi:hypothetical protein